MKGLLIQKVVTPTVRRPRVDLTSPQMALILALEGILQASGLWLVCDHCARERETYSHLITQNAPEDTVWTIDCPCTDRRFLRASLQHTMRPSGDLGFLLPDLTRATGLDVRCPNKRSGCLTTPILIKPEPDGMTWRCQCWTLELGAGIYRFTKREAAA